MNEPIIKNIKEQNRQIELLLSFPKAAVYFQGHFPETPILPGFVQVHYAMFFLKRFWKIEGALSNIKKLKFTRIISPDLEVTLVLEKAENGKISFKYKDEQRIYSSGEFYHV